MIWLIDGLIRGTNSNWSDHLEMWKRLLIRKRVQSATLFSIVTHEQQMQNHQVPCSIKSAWYYSFYHEIFTFEIILFNWFDQLFIHMLNLFIKVISQWIEKKNWRHIRTTQATKLPNAFFRSFLLSRTTIKIAMRHLNSYRILNLATFYALKYIIWTTERIKHHWIK